MSAIDNQVVVRFEVHCTIFGRIEFWFWRLLSFLGVEPTDEAIQRLAERMFRIREIRA